MKCRAELCPTWTGQGCICTAIGLEPPLSDDDLYDAPEGAHTAAEHPLGWGPIFTAGHHSEDACCGDGIVPGEDIRADGSGGWIHAHDQCEKLAAGTLTEKDLQISACSRCFITHAPGQGIECC